MRAFVLAVFGGVILAACKGEDDSSPGETDSDALDTEPENDTGYPSTFAGGKYRLTRFELRALDDGGDVDGDGTPDNNLPNLLTTASFVVTDAPLAPDDLNANIAAQIEAGTLAILLDAAYDGDLGVDVLGGAWDPASGAITVDPASYDGGAPRSHLDGEFATETSFAAGPGRIDVPVVFVPEEPALLVPFERAVLTGDMDGEGYTGMLAGVVPAQAMIDQVIVPMLPPEGYDINGDGIPTMDEVMDIVESFVTNEHMADVLFEDGTRGVSAAFTCEAVAAEFEGL